MLDRNHMLDIATKHFITEKNPPGWDMNVSICTYRSSVGHHCIVGLWAKEAGTPEDHPIWGSGSCVETVLDSGNAPAVFEDLSTDDREFLTRCQIIHDRWATRYYNPLDGEFTKEEALDDFRSSLDNERV